jgi:hypothetical protein
MEWACINGTRAHATPRSVGICPSCGSEVSAKCGEVNAWHWAHRGGDCDPWSEGETRWHLNWKQLFPPEWQEVVVHPHRADVKTPKMVVELQHSLINPAMIREREQFYENMVWLFDLRHVQKNIFLHEPNYLFHRLHVPHRLKLFVWRRARRSWFACTKPVLVHLARGKLYNVFGFGYYSDLNFAGGFARRLDEQQFLAAVGASDPINDSEPSKLVPFDAIPSLEIAKNWQPYWDDERMAHWKTPLFTIRQYQQQPTGLFRIVRLVTSVGQP